MTYVLVHGGGFDARCWDPLLPHLAHPARAIDLPGRGARPADLASVTLADFVDAVVDELVTHDLHDVVLVGHSLAGITLPGVAAAAGDRLRRLVFVSAAAPAEGTSVAEVLASFSPAAAELVERMGSDLIADDGRLHPALATVMFCNDMDEELTARTLGWMVPEAPGVIVEPVVLRGVTDVPRTYVRLRRDQILTLATQDEMIANLGGADVVDLDCAHMAMISEPAALAAILDGL